jgi:hypothetical protein
MAVIGRTGTAVDDEQDGRGRQPRLMAGRALTQQQRGGDV